MGDHVGVYYVTVDALEAVVVDFVVDGDEESVPSRSSEEVLPVVEPDPVQERVQDLVDHVEDLRPMGSEIERVLRDGVRLLIDLTSFSQIFSRP
ncbi:unnamed protein product [Tenebrio molitor]|nr:unnamed protein product [Tenebrio molitor]